MNHKVSHVCPAALTERQTTASGGKEVRKSEPNTQLLGREPQRSPHRTAGNSSKVNQRRDRCYLEFYS